MGGAKVTDISDELGKSLTEFQVKLRANKRFQQLVVAVTMFAVFCDILGSATIIPGLAAVCSYAEGGPYDIIVAEAAALGLTEDDQVTKDMVDEIISPHAFKGEKGAWDGSPPFKFSMAMNFVLSLGMVGSAAGSFFFGKLCDKIGAKIPMQICLLAGIGGYVIIYASAIWVKSYYLFVIGFVWNSFFGVCVDLAFTYFGQTFEGEERDQYQQGVMGMMLIGGTIGAFIVMPFSNSPKNGENYFKSMWLAMGFTAVALVGVTLVMVPPGEKKDDDKEKDKKKDDVDADKLSPRAIKILKILLVASALDSGGDEGTRMARGTILSALFPEWSTTARQNYLLLSLLLIVIITMVVLTLLRKVTSLPVIAVIGCVFTLATQLLLILEIDSDATFLIIWNVGKLFGFLSTITAGFIITEVCPKEQLGYWNGMNNVFSNLSQAVSPLIFSAVYDGVGNVRGQEMLACTAAVSLLATLAYVPLIWMMPKPQKKMKLELEDIETYEKMTDAEWGALPMEILDQVSTKLVEAGKLPRQVHWGDYHEERPLLYDLQARAGADFKYMSESFCRMLSDRRVLVQEQQNFKKLMGMMPKVDREKALKEMGMWIAHYFDDAGYIQWETQAPIYKAMIMTAFPPIDPLDAEKPEFENMKVLEFEHNLTKFLKVMDNHLAADRSNRSISDVNMFTTLLRRR